MVAKVVIFLNNNNKILISFSNNSENRKFIYSNINSNAKNQKINSGHTLPIADIAVLASNYKLITSAFDSLNSQFFVYDIKVSVYNPILIWSANNIFASILTTDEKNGIIAAYSFINNQISIFSISDTYPYVLLLNTLKTNALF